MATLAVVKGKDRTQNILDSLEAIRDVWEPSLRRAKQILVKPNLVAPGVPLAITQPETVETVVRALAQSAKAPIVIAEGCPRPYDTLDAFAASGYDRLAERLDVKLVDLNRDEWIRFEVFDAQLQSASVRVARTVWQSDFRVSVSPLKTHDTVVMTAALKNMLVGSLVTDAAQDDKSRLHQGYRAINESLAKLARVIPPHLAVVDAFQAMEGDGPEHGTAVEMHVALAGIDFLAVESACAYLAGFKLRDIGYLWLAEHQGLGEADLSHILQVGNTSLEECRRTLRPHSTFARQRRWR